MGLKGNQKKGNDGKFVANPVAKPNRPLKDTPIGDVARINNQWYELTPIDREADEDRMRRIEDLERWGMSTEAAEDIVDRQYRSGIYTHPNEQWEQVQNVSLNNRVRVTWVYAEEGFDGDYDWENPEDRPLMRFDAEINVNHLTDEEINDWDGSVSTDGWVSVRNSTYCTQVELGTDKAALMALAGRMADSLDQAVYEGPGAWKRRGELLSHLGTGDANLALHNPV